MKQQKKWTNEPSILYNHLLRPSCMIVATFKQCTTTLAVSYFIFGSPEDSRAKKHQARGKCFVRIKICSNLDLMLVTTILRKRFF
jgi:hypothetical protein